MLNAYFRPAILFAHGDLHWEQFHMMISRSTTPDIIKMVSKIEEFVVNQFTSSRRVLSAFGPMPGTKRGSDRRKMSDDIDCEIVNLSFIIYNAPADIHPPPLFLSTMINNSGFAYNFHYVLIIPVSYFDLQSQFFFASG